MKEQLSMYMTTQFCKECGWFCNPYKPFSGNACPECGNETNKQVGRFKYVTKRHWLFFKQTFLVEFIPGRKEKKVNKKVKKMSGM